MGMNPFLLILNPPQVINRWGGEDEASPNNEVEASMRKGHFFDLQSIMLVAEVCIAKDWLLKFPPVAQ